MPPLFLHRVREPPSKIPQFLVNYPSKSERKVFTNGRNRSIVRNYKGLNRLYFLTLMVKEEDEQGFIHNSNITF